MFFDTSSPDLEGRAVTSRRRDDLFHFEAINCPYTPDVVHANHALWMLIQRAANGREMVEMMVSALNESQIKHILDCMTISPHFGKYPYLNYRPDYQHRRLWVLEQIRDKLVYEKMKAMMKDFCAEMELKRKQWEEEMQKAEMVGRVRNFTAWLMDNGYWNHIVFSLIILHCGLREV